MMTPACNSNSKRVRQEDGELKASLGCTVNSRLTSATSGNYQGKRKTQIPKWEGSANCSGFILLL